MGWSFSCVPGRLKDEIADRVRTQEQTDPQVLAKVSKEVGCDKITWETIAHCFRGAVTHSGRLWKVVKMTWWKDGKELKSDKFLALDLMECRGKCWGYKDLEESMGPYNVDCPLSYLDMVPDPGGNATAWREKVRAYHAKRAASKSVAKAVKVGDWIELLPGYTVKQARVEQLVPMRRGYRIIASGYRIGPTKIARIIPPEEVIA